MTAVAPHGATHTVTGRVVSRSMRQKRRSRVLIPKYLVILEGSWDGGRVHGWLPEPVKVGDRVQFKASYDHGSVHNKLDFNSFTGAREVVIL